MLVLEEVSVVELGSNDRKIIPGTELGADPDASRHQQRQHRD